MLESAYPAACQCLLGPTSTTYSPIYTVATRGSEVLDTSRLAAWGEQCNGAEQAKVITAEEKVRPSDEREISNGSCHSRPFDTFSVT